MEFIPDNEFHTVLTTPILALHRLNVLPRQGAYSHPPVSELPLRTSASF